MSSLRPALRSFLLAIAYTLAEASRYPTDAHQHSSGMVLGRRLQGDIGVLSQAEFIVVVIASVLGFLLIIALVLLALIIIRQALKKALRQSLNITPFNAGSIDGNGSSS